MCLPRTYLENFSQAQEPLSLFEHTFSECSCHSLKQAYVWTPAHDKAFQKVKEEITSPHVLALYDLGKLTKISADLELVLIWSYSIAVNDVP